MDSARVAVDLGNRSYFVQLGSGVRHLLAGIVAGLGAQRVGLVSARPAEWLPDPGVESVVPAARDGETGKALRPWSSGVASSRISG